jgi:hypothetical protein
MDLNVARKMKKIFLDQLLVCTVTVHPKYWCGAS